MNTTTIGFPNLGIDSFELNKFLVENLFGTGIRIAWYGFIICLGMIAAYFIITHNGTKKEGIILDSLIDYFLVTIPLGVIGARAMYVLTNLDYYDSFDKIIAVWNGGLAIYGGVIVGIIAILVTAKIKKHCPLAVLDAIIPGLLIAQSMGRWGNFINGEAHGGYTESLLAMTVNGNGPFHPTFLYESIVTLTGFIIAEFILYKKKRFNGEIFSFYLVWYGIGRFFIEGLRTDSLYIGSLRASQLISVIAVLCGIGITVYSLKFKKKPAIAESLSESSTENSESNEIASESEKADDNAETDTGNISDENDGSESKETETADEKNDDN